MPYPIHKNAFTSTLISILIGCYFVLGMSCQSASISEHTDPASAKIEALLHELTLEEKVGQLFSIRANGEFSNYHDPHILRIERLIADYHIGGVTFFAGNVYGQATLHNRLQQAARLPLWVSQDMEFGAAMRIDGTTRITPAMGIAATGNTENAYLQGKITAEEAKAMKVNQVFAPVMDVNNNPLNPVIGIRSFSADPDMVADYAIRFMEGVEGEGLLATGKHFPGHGDTDTDSHLALPTVPHNYARLDSVELVPFKKSIQRGLRSVMSAHISYPSISPNPNLPATLDPSILEQILIDSLQFNGLIVTDALEMHGITNHYSPDEAVIMALNAGADIMLLSPDEMTAIDGVIKAVETGRISEERINQSVRKILALKEEQNLFEDRFIDLNTLTALINTPGSREIASRIARESITVLKNDLPAFPIDTQNTSMILVLSVTDRNTHSSGSVLAGEIRKYHSYVNYRELNNRTTEAEAEEIIQLAKNSDLVIAGSFIFTRPAGSSQFPPLQLQTLREIEAMDTHSMLIAFGSPYAVSDLPGFHSHILAWSSNITQIQNTVPALFGASAVTGKLPAGIPGMYEIGHGLEYPKTTLRLDTPESAGLITDSLLQIDMIMQQAIEDSVFPGGVVAVMRQGKLVWQHGYGYHDYTKTHPTTTNSVFDLASITKVMATTTAVMKLVGEGKISLDDPIHKFIPEFDTPQKRPITIRHFLLHNSGLPAFRIYVDKLRSRPELIEAIRNEPLINKPGEVYVYSDLGFILLEEIIFEVTGQRLNEYAKENIFMPLGMNDTTFNPELVISGASSRIPPTEIDTVYHRGTVHMNVHDERAYFMGGIAGHAGLFASARDIATYADMILQKGSYGGKQILEPEIVDLFTTKQSPLNHRGLGFDRKREDFISAGELTGEQTFGHTGFTGTSLWIDPDQELAIILLTNRTYPNRAYGFKISDVRGAVADAVIKSIQKTEAD